MEKKERVFEFNTSTVTLKFGDITESSAEVIVSSDDTILTMSGGVSNAILRAGGELIKSDALKQLPANVGDVVISCAGRLPQKFVFHCLTIDEKYLKETWAGLKVETEDKVNQIIRSVIDRCFQFVYALNINSIAFPVIGSGNAHMPFDVVIEAMADEMLRKLQETNRQINVEVYIYDRVCLPISLTDLMIVFAAKEAVSKYLIEKNALPYNGTPVSLSNEDVEKYRNLDHDVFISYKREEFSQAYAINELLKQWGIKTWIDKNGIFSSYDFKVIIEKAIEKAKVVLFLSSEKSNQSEYIKKEIKYAITCNKRIIPVMLDDAPFADGLRMDLANIDQINFSHPEEFQKKLKTSLDYILRMT